MFSFASGSRFSVLGRAFAWAVVGFAVGGGLSARAQKRGVWLTTPDRINLLARQEPLHWKKTTAAAPGDITIDDSQRFQTMDGFGHAITGGSAELLMKMSPGARTALLQELFGHGENDLSTSYIRVSVGASDMNDHVYTYDDLPVGETDPELKHFALGEDRKDVLPVLKQVLAINPRLRILASPWTAPAWMKSNGEVKAGSLKPEFYATYAAYLVRYLQAMQAEGITIDTLTPQNEPENDNNTPSMLVTSAEEATFIGKHLGPAIAAAGLKTKIVDFDHNCDHPEYAISLLKDPEAAKYTDGSGFHLYYGKMTALTVVHEAFPGKNLYFTEQTVIPDRKDTHLLVAEPVARLIVGAPKNWSRNVLLWNLAADAQNGPHTGNGGCPVCTGALRLEGDKVTRLVAYYVAGHASKFVPEGSVRVGSAGGNGPAGPGSLPHVAYRTPAGRHVLIVSNTSEADSRFRVQDGGKAAETELPAGSVATYVW